MIAAVDPNARVQPVSAQPTAAETTPQGGRKRIAVVGIIAIVGVIAGVSFFMKQKNQ